jgi:mannose-6-phosphate isomerase class I
MEESFSNDDRFQVHPSKDYYESKCKYILLDTKPDKHPESNDKEELIILAVKLNRLQPKH